MLTVRVHDNYNFIALQLFKVWTQMTLKVASFQRSLEQKVVETSKMNIFDDGPSKNMFIATK